MRMGDQIMGSTMAGRPIDACARRPRKLMAGAEECLQCGRTMREFRMYQCGSSARTDLMACSGRTPSALRLRRATHMLCIARRHPWQPYDCCATRPLAVNGIGGHLAMVGGQLALRAKLDPHFGATRKNLIEAHCDASPRTADARSSTGAGDIGLSQ